MESLVGPDNMQNLIREWINEKKQKSATYIMFQEKFQSFLQENYNADEAQEIESKMMYDRWIKEPGLPPVQFDFTTKALNESLDLAD